MGYKFKAIYDELSEKIATGELGPGDKLPSLSQLRVDYKCSYGPVRDALLILKAEGVIQGKHGVGMFVSPREEWK